MRISDWSSDVCSSDLGQGTARERCGCGVDLWLWLAGLSRRADVLGRYRRLEEDRRRAGEARVRRGAAPTRESGQGYAVHVVSVPRPAPSCRTRSGLQEAANAPAATLSGRATQATFRADGVEWCAPTHPTHPP